MTAVQKAKHGPISGQHIWTKNHNDTEHGNTWKYSSWMVWLLPEIREFPFRPLHTTHICNTVQDTVVEWDRMNDWEARIPQNVTKYLTFLRLHKESFYFQRREWGAESHYKSHHCAQQSKQHRTQHSRQKQTFIFFYSFQWVSLVFLRWISIKSTGLLL